MDPVACPHRTVVAACPPDCTERAFHLHWRCSEGCDSASGPDSSAMLAASPAATLDPTLRARASAVTVPMRAVTACGHAECVDFCHRRYSGEAGPG